MTAGDGDYTTSTPKQWKGSYTTISTAVDGTETTSTSPRSVVWTNTATKGRNPHWRSDIAHNRNATTNLTGYACDVSVSSGYCWAEKKVKPSTGSYKKEVLGEYFTPEIDSSLTLTGLSSSVSTDMAKQRFLKKLIEAQQSMQGLVALGELGETLRMLRRPARALYNKFLNWNTVARKLRPRRGAPKRGRSDSIKSWERRVANEWLQYSYGVRPLIADIDDAGRAINKWGDWYGEKIMLAAKGVDDQSSQTTVSEQIDGVFRFKKTVVVNTSCVTVIAGATRTFAMNPVQFQSRLFGFSPESFVPSLYELIPWSFAVDYFTNINEIVNGWAWQRCGLAWARLTTIKMKDRTYDSWPRVVDATYKPIVLTHSIGRSVSKQVSRSPYTDNFMPELRFEIPGLSMKWLNMAALGRARFAK